MNNVAVATLMLPVVMDIACETDCSLSALLVPLAYGSLLDGLTTMICTPPNLLMMGPDGYRFIDYLEVGAR
jgi:di/tricarboxylate transporter